MRVMMATKDTNRSRPPRKWLLAVIALTLMLLMSAASGQEVGTAEAQPYDERFGDMVSFPGIDSPVRVSSLRAAAGLNPNRMKDVLPEGIVENIVKARDRNALWLICEGRRDYSSISYTFNFTNHQTVKRVCPVKGKYDRGLYFRIPSEYALYQARYYSDYFFEEDAEYFKMTLPAEAAPEDDSCMYHHGIPNYIHWASPARMGKPLPWWSEREMAGGLPLLRNSRDIQYGYEFWFAKPDLKLVKEVIKEPVFETGAKGSLNQDIMDEEVTTEIRYTYTPGYDYPARVSVYQRGFLAAELEFSLFDGFWMLQKGDYYSYSGLERFPFTIWTEDIAVQH